MTARVRWRPGVCGNLLGYVGTLRFWSFQIYQPGDPERGQYKLMAQLPGVGTAAARSSNPDELKAEAERWLEGFVSSLGAVFAVPATTGEPDRVTVMLLHDPDSGAVVDLAVYEDGLKAAADAQQVSDDSGYTVQIWTDRPYIRGTLATRKEG